MRHVFASITIVGMIVGFAKAIICLITHNNEGFQDGMILFLVCAPILREYREQEESAHVMRKLDELVANRRNQKGV